MSKEVGVPRQPRPSARPDRVHGDGTVRAAGAAAHQWNTAATAGPLKLSFSTLLPDFIL